MNVDLGNSYLASGHIADYSIVKFGANAKVLGDRLAPSVAQAASGADALIGVTGKIPPLRMSEVRRSGEPVTVEPEPGQTQRAAVIHTGLASVLLGGAVTRGDFVTSDALGYGVLAIAGDRFVAVALEDGKAGDGIDVLVQLGVLPAATSSRTAKGI